MPSPTDNSEDPGLIHEPACSNIRPQESVVRNLSGNAGTGKRALRLTALFLFTFAIYLPGTSVLPFFDRDEADYAEVSREMKESGDYLMPHFNGKIWLEKPPLLYWCETVSFRLFGENEFAARFPDVLATALTALVVFGFCSSLYDSRIAWRAALIFLLCVQALAFGRAGVMDMPLTLFTTLGAWASWEMCRGNLRKIWWWIFYVSLACAALAKGPVAVLPLGGVLVFAWLARIPNFHRTMKFGRGLMLATFLAGLWFVPVLVLTGGELIPKFFGEQVLAKLYTSQQGHGAANALVYLLTLPIYFILLLPAFLPWTFYIPAACRRMNRERTLGDLFLASGILLTFCLFSLLRTKLPHYTLPAFPLIACAVAPSIPERQLFRLGAGMIAICLAVAFILPPLAAPYCVQKRLAASPLLQKDMAMAAADYSEPNLVWYMRGRVKALKKAIPTSEVAGFMNESGPRFCVLPSKDAEKIPIDPSWKQLVAGGIDAVHGKRIELWMFVKTGE